MEKNKKIVSSPIHLKTIKIFPKIASGSTIESETDKIPRWDDAIYIWHTNAVNYSLILTSIEYEGAIPSGELRI